MNRNTIYGLLFLGVPLGYLASYFGQPGALRLFLSLGEYTANFRSSLAPGENSFFGDNEELTRSVFITGWIGIIVGVAIMGAVVMVKSKKKKDDVTPR